MQNVMYKPFRNPGLIFAIVICSIFLGLNGCENPGSVGSGLAGPDADVITDTIFVEGVQTIEPVSYSGDLPFFSAGHYNDPLFGEMETTSFLKPSLPSGDNDMQVDSKMILRILLDNNQIYGDKSAPQEFGIYEIDELWRDRALRVYDKIQIKKEDGEIESKLGEFTVGNEDSLDIELPSSWVTKYRQFTNNEDNADSLYRYNFHGLAIVPENDSKIIPIRRDSTRFIIQNPEADTFDVALNQSGYVLERDQSDIPEGSAPFYSTYESVINFNSLGVADLDIQASAFSRAELVFHQNNAALEQSLQSEPTSVRRPQGTRVYLHFVDSVSVPDNIDPVGEVDNTRRIEGVYSATDGTYRFNITNLVDRIIQAGVPEDLEFFMTSPNDGVIKSGLIYTDSDQVPKDKRPQIIITSLKNNNK